MSRESDERLCSLADRLRLPYLRDHMTGECHINRVNGFI